MSRDSPRAGVDYPGSYAALRAWFPTDAAGLDYLDWLRWPDGFRCPLCRGTKAWKLPDGRWSCGVCGRRVSATAGTIFHGTRTPLTVWFAAAWLMVSQKQGISALGLKRTLGIGSEQTAWAMLHRFRTAMVRPGRDRLRGFVEADETFLGGPEPGVRGRGAQGKVMVEVAVERDGRALGRCRLQVIEDVAGSTLREFMLAHVEPGSVVTTDGLASYRPACGEEYEHRPEPIGPSGSRRTNYCPECTASRRSPSAGCSAPTKAASSPGTCRRTWTSSPSASTAGDHEPEGCSSTDCSNKQCRPLLAHTARSSSIPAQGGAACYPRRPTNACAQPVSTAIRWIARGVSLRGDPWSSDVASGLH